VKKTERKLKVEREHSKQKAKKKIKEETATRRTEK
jgi:hypothetical protein